MHQPGRVSADAASVILPAEATQLTDRLQPPAQLGAREAEEWQAITARLGHGWFPKETHALLVAYCVTKTQIDDLNAAFTELGPGVPEDPPRWARYQSLTRLRLRLTAQLASLAGKLRLSQSARFDRHWAGAEARRRGNGTPPWAQGDGEPH